MSDCPKCPSLPPELWIRILSYHGDLNHLWSTCRQVSSTFQAYVDQVFAEKHLRTTYIDFNLEIYNLGGKGRRPEIPTTFDRFSENKVLVYFKDKRDGGAFGSTEMMEKSKARWDDQIKSCKAECPHYTIRIGRHVNDTALPGLALDVEEREVSFEWRGMLHAFFREEERMRLLAKGWHDEARDIAKKVSASEMGQADQTVWSRTLPTMSEKIFRKSIRRARLKVHYRDNEEMLWAINAMQLVDSSTRWFMEEVPGSRVGERFYKSKHLPSFLLVDEWSSLHSIDTKAELVALDEKRDDSDSTEAWYGFHRCRYPESQLLSARS
ncbi:hypothetical protein K432DRAFT_424204 [Lepidopterella palustris CBS 459.81]|uniref:F-box domain-containing protein n=1 Tax=Lepidopterella palustris CBS 459.81 TaxID=1314670 RepID=A0A8E2EEH7_9PEZI|nr:hypothetical protein K432DRAFT_424204 [Lepidopterella palustris CBS 459.81]